MGALYIVVQLLVLVGTAVTMYNNNICHSTTVFFLSLTILFIFSAVIHPQVGGLEGGWKGVGGRLERGLEGVGGRLEGRLEGVGGRLEGRLEGVGGKLEGRLEGVGGLKRG